MSDANVLNPGDVVRLKSGGPKMTVNWCEDHYGVLSVNCDYFVQDKAPWKKENVTFPVTSVVLLEAGGQ